MSKMTVLVMRSKSPVKSNKRAKKASPGTRYRASVVVCHQESLLTVRLRDPVSGIVRNFLPGGAVEAGEHPVDAAVRECLEETGYAVAIDRNSAFQGAYLFRWAGKDVPCVTDFFRAYLADPVVRPVPVSDAPELNQGIEWIPLSKMDDVLGYHPQILSCVKKILGQPPRQVLCAFSAFKRTLTALEACDAAANAIRAAGHLATTLPLADGGRGSLDLWVSCMTARGLQPTLLDFQAVDPLGRATQVRVGMLSASKGTTLFIESADCLGIHLVGSPSPATAMVANSYGLGLLLRDIARRFPAGTHVIIGLGDSAVNDCGAGMLLALGFRLTLKSGGTLSAAQFNAGLLREMATMDPPSFGSAAMKDLQALGRLQWTVLCDVINPLCGPKGAMTVFAAQKGALADQIKVLGAGARNVSKLFAAKSPSRKWTSMEMGGASGGVAAALAWALRARLKPGARWFVDAARFRKIVKQQDIMFSGEGSSDAQSPSGKAPFVFLVEAQNAGVATGLVSGRLQIHSWPRQMRAKFLFARACGTVPDAATALSREVWAGIVKIITDENASVRL